MKKSELQFTYPEELVATEPARPTRVMYVDGPLPPQELTCAGILQKLKTGDLLVVNNTKVLHRRIFAAGLEILFLNKISERTWKVLFPSRKYQLGDEIQLPGNVIMKLMQKGRPQTVEVSADLDEKYFERWAELPLPPYIQKARNQRNTTVADESWYQTQWSKVPGSLAAPTASLHFSQNDLADLKSRGVEIVELTLHVGLGTFLPVTAEDLNDHEMHEEWIEISPGACRTLRQAKKDRKKIWVLGTTAARSVESFAQGLLTAQPDGSHSGHSRLFIMPGFQFTYVDVLMTNFHQPESTLLALVAAYAGLEKVKACYEWAISHRFRLFSYGDLSVWTKE